MDAEIIKILAKNLLNIEEKKIQEIYKVLNSGKTDELKTEQLHDFYKKWKNIGTDFQIDLPYFIHSENKTTKRIMFIGQDANNNKTKIKDKIKINAPFSFQSKKYSDINNSYNPVFNKLKKDYNIFLTDLYKLFFYYDKERKSNEHSDYISNEIHKTILLNEIKQIIPNIIVTFGEPARKVFEDNQVLELCKENNIQIVNTPHPRAWHETWIEAGAEGSTHENKINFILEKISKTNS